jgi:hypothetical protein
VKVINDKASHYLGLIFSWLFILKQLENNSIELAHICLRRVLVMALINTEGL